MCQTVVEGGVLLFQSYILVFDVAKTVENGLDCFVQIASDVSLKLRTIQTADVRKCTVSHESHYAVAFNLYM